MTRSIIITEQCENGITYYGIDVNENNKSSSYIRLTEHKEKIEQLKGRLLNPDISAVHINDIIIDFIEEDACNKLLLNSLL